MPDWITGCVYGAVTMETLGSRLEGRELSDQDIAERSEQVIALIVDGALRRTVI
jgi:hypothetical protein